MVSNVCNHKRLCVTRTWSTAYLKEWEESGTGKIAHKFVTIFHLRSWPAERFHLSGVEAILKLRPTEAQVSSGGPALQQRWESFFQHRPDKPMATIVPCAGYATNPLKACKLFMSTLFH